MKKIIKPFNKTMDLVISSHPNSCTYSISMRKHTKEKTFVSYVVFGEEDIEELIETFQQIKENIKLSKKMTFEEKEAFQTTRKAVDDTVVSDEELYCFVLEMRKFE